jgi:hypothetical protein
MFSKSVGKSAGVMGLAGKARSTGGRALTGTTGGLHAGANYLSAFGAKHGGSSGRVVGGIGKGLSMASRHPKSVMGAAAGGIGYMGYRNRKGAQGNPLAGFE